jgi:hypothetical protein
MDSLPYKGWRKSPIILTLPQYEEHSLKLKKQAFSKRGRGK